MLGKCTNPDGTVRNDAECKCDIGIGSWWENSGRTAVEFLPPYGHDGFYVVVHIDNTWAKHNFFFFVEAFPLEVWISIAGLMFCFTLLKLMDGRVQQGRRLEYFNLALRDTGTYFCFHLPFIEGPFLSLFITSLIPKVFSLHSLLIQWKEFS